MGPLMGNDVAVAEYSYNIDHIQVTGKMCDTVWTSIHVGDSQGMKLRTTTKCSERVDECYHTWAKPGSGPASRGENAAVTHL